MKKCTECGARFGGVAWKCPSCQATPRFIDKYPSFSPEFLTSGEGFKAEYFAKLADLEKNNFWFCSRNKLILWAMRKYFLKVNSFLEIGCGTGFVLSSIEEAFPSLLLYGSDVFCEGIKFAERRLKKATLLHMDARKIPFEDEFDVVGAFDVLEHIGDDELVLSQIYSATCKGGGMILTVPQHPFLWSQFDEASCHIRRYDSKELRKKVTNAGFTIIDSISFVSLLFPLMAMMRLKKRVPDDKYDIMANLDIKGVKNVILEKTLDCERFLIGLGMRLPFGGSLLLVARKTS